ncbi:DNA replication complex GINS protein SLD5 [Gurleya vavrai]
MSLITNLITAFTNEKNTKDLLYYKTDLIEEIKKILKYQKNYIEKIDKKNKILKSIYEQDFERVAYFLQEYLLVRLKKITKNFEIFEEKLSVEEKIFKGEMVNLAVKNEFYHKSEFVNNEYMCFVVVCDNKNIIIDGNDILMREGDIFVCALEDVKHMLIENEIILF